MAEEAGTIVVALLGAESTGKTTLAAALAARLAAETGLRCTWVAETLREWCDRQGRTPRAHEQAGIAQAQHERIRAAAASHDVVVCDTTALMTAVYSRLIFADESLVAAAVDLHRTQVDLSLLTALDLPWEADGHQRDGPQVRQPVDRALRELLDVHRLPWALVSGRGPQRLDSALDALAPLLRSRAAPRAGLLGAPAPLEAAASAPHRPCGRRDAPEREHATRQPGDLPLRPEREPP